MVRQPGGTVRRTEVQPLLDRRLEGRRSKPGDLSLEGRAPAGAFSRLEDQGRRGGLTGCRPFLGGSRLVPPAVARLRDRIVDPVPFPGRVRRVLRGVVSAGRVMR